MSECKSSSFSSRVWLKSVHVWESQDARGAIPALDPLTRRLTLTPVDTICVRAGVTADTPDVSGRDPAAQMEAEGGGGGTVSTFSRDEVEGPRLLRERRGGGVEQPAQQQEEGRGHGRLWRHTNSREKMRSVTGLMGPLNHAAFPTKPLSSYRSAPSSRI